MAEPDMSSPMVERRQYNRYTVFVVSFICLGSASFGYSASVLSTGLSLPSFQKHFHLDTASNKAQIEGMMNSLYFTGGFFGAVLSGWMCKAFGRKASVIAGALVVLVSGGLLAASVNNAMFIAFRFFNGLGSFQLLTTVPFWVAEIVPPRSRGMLTDFHAVFLNAAFTVASYAGLGFSFYSNKDSWRAHLALQMIPPTILLSGLYWMPESPRYLLLKDRSEEASAIVHRLHASPTDPNHDFAKREFYQMRKQLELDTRLSASYSEIFKRPSFRKRALYTMALTFLTQSCGTLVINNYGSLIYASLGYGTTQILLLQSGYQVTALVMNVVAMFIVDRMKRNRLMAVGFFLCMTTLIVETALQKNFLNTTNSSGLAAAAAILFLYVTSYSLFLDGATYFYIAELWPSHLRSQGYALGIGAFAVTNIIWLQTAPTGFAHIHWRYYIIAIVFAAVGCVVALFVFPDTLHKPLEEIAALFGDDDLVVVYERDLRITKEGVLETVHGKGGSTEEIELA